MSDDRNIEQNAAMDALAAMRRPDDEVDADIKIALGGIEYLSVRAHTAMLRLPNDIHTLRAALATTEAENERLLAANAVLRAEAGALGFDADATSAAAEWKMLSEQLAAERDALLRERSIATTPGLHAESDLPDRYLVQPHRPTLDLIGHRMAEMANDPDPENPYSDMSPEEALDAILGGIRADATIVGALCLGSTVDPDALFTYEHHWVDHRFIPGRLGQVVQRCACTAERVMYPSGHCNCARNELGMATENSGNCVVHPTPGCPNPTCGNTWIASFHGDHCDSCGWAAPDGASIVDMTPRVLAWMQSVLPHEVARMKDPEQWIERNLDGTKACGR